MTPADTPRSPPADHPQNEAKSLLTAPNLVAGLGILIGVPGFLHDVGSWRLALLLVAAGMLMVGCGLRAVELWKSARLDLPFAALALLLALATFVTGMSLQQERAPQSGPPDRAGSTPAPTPAPATSSPDGGSTSSPAAGGPSPNAEGSSTARGSTAPSRSTPTKPAAPVQYLDGARSGGDSVSAGGSYTLGGRAYGHGLGINGLCTASNTSWFVIGPNHSTFTAVVGVPLQSTERLDRFSSVEFDVFVDLNGDDSLDDSEKVAARTVQSSQPSSVLTADVRGASEIYLLTRAQGDCFVGTAVWADARVT